MLSSAQLRALFELKGEARELAATREACRQYVLDRVVELFRASAGYLVRSERESSCHRIVAATLYNFDGVTRPAFAVLLQRGVDFNPLVREQLAHTDGARRFVVSSIGADLRRGAWRETEYYVDYVRPSGLGDALISATRFDDLRTTFGYGLFRKRGARPFTADDKLFIECLELGLSDFVHRPDGPPRPARRLTTRERDVLDAMLAGLSDKDITERLHITRHTVNQYAKRLYVAFDVHSRSELIALHIHAARRRGDPR